MNHSIQKSINHSLRNALILFICLCLVILADPSSTKAQDESVVQSNQSTDTHNSCQRGDVNCDGQHDIVDLQLFAMAYGQRTSERTDGEALDLNKDSLIDETDLRMLRRAWRTGYSVHAFADAPTFGYAVDDAGNVFLRWQLASDPYTAPIEILRDPAPAGAPASGIGTAGIVATVQPIYDQAMAESLLGEYWETLRNGFVVDSDGNPVPLATISDVHNHVQAGEQPMLVDWLSNRDTGVAQVFAKGYFDTDFAAGTGSYQYWVRAGSELAGPIAIDTTQRTELPAVTGVDAFDAEGSIPTLEADTNELVHTRILREAHASIYVLWNLDLGLNENDPVWPNGFNVWRQECDPGPTNCLPFEQQNEYSVFPQPLPVDVHNAESISNDRIVQGTEAHEFEWYWADSDLDTSKEYCYMVTALDMLGQDGAGAPFNADACLQPPDYRPPTPASITDVETIYHGEGQLADISVTFEWGRNDPENADWQGFAIYRAKSALAVWPYEWELVSQTTPDECGESVTLVDSGVEEHANYWYRVVIFDKAGNRSMPSAPASSRVDDIYPPAKPRRCLLQPQQVCLDEDAVKVRIFRRYGPNGFPLLIDEAPAENFSWVSWQDDYEPLRETEFYYEMIAIDEAGNVSELSTMGLTQVLSVGQTQKLIPPVLENVEISQSLDGVVRWTTTGEENLSHFNIYRAKGDDPPTLTSMSKIGEGTVEELASGERSYRFDDNTGGITHNAVYWYAVEAVDIAGKTEASSPYPARYVNLDDPSDRYQGTFPLLAYWVDYGDPNERNGVVLRLEEEDGTGHPQSCCYVVFRSRNSTTNFSQITPIIPFNDVFYIDTDVYPGDEVYYQVIRVLAGVYTGSSIDTTTATGEIAARSAVVKAEGIPDRSIAETPHTDPGPGIFVPGPNDPPTVLHFGTWDMTVQNYTNTTKGLFAGTGFVNLEPAPGIDARVQVDFSGVNANDFGDVISMSGAANVLVGQMLVEYSDRILYRLENMSLDPDGALADVTILRFGENFRLWELDPNGPGEPIIVTQAGVRIDDPTLRFSQTVPMSQNCLQPQTQIQFPFGLSDWPLAVVPKADFTVTETGVQFGATCTLYRDRYSGDSGGGGPIQAELDYRNDYFLKHIAGSTEPASYTVTDGLSGHWVSVIPANYKTAFPFEIAINSLSRSFRFVNDTLTAGEQTAGTINFAYQNDTSNDATDTFNGTFVKLDILEGGAVFGSISSNDAIAWEAFSVADGNYDLYTPPPMTADLPNETWPASLGTAESGLPGDEREQPGLNAHKKNFTWSACPTPAVPSEPLFPDNEFSDVDLYVRRAGVSGVVEMNPPGDGIAVSLAGYQWFFTKFAQSWLDNWPYDSATAGRIYLPYPAEAIFEFDQLLLNEDGCAVSGLVLPNEEDLDYWQLIIRPWAVFFDESDKLWVELETDVNNLARVDGAADDPIVEVAVAFNPDGTFHDADVYPQDTVYTVDGFYVVMQDLRLSAYDPGGNHEKAGWDEAATLTAGPCLPQDGGCTPTAGLEGGFVALDAGVYLPSFGEVTNPNSDEIFLLGAHPYVGFNRAPLAEYEVSPALDIRLQYNLLYAQSRNDLVASRWVGYATEDGRDISVLDETGIAEVTLMTVMNSYVATADEDRIFFGFPSGAATFLATYEVWKDLPTSTPPSNQNEMQALFEGWCTSGVDSSNGPLLGDLWGVDIDCAAEAQFAAYLIKTENLSNYKTLIEDITHRIGPDNDVGSWITENEYAGINTDVPLFESKLASSPLKLQYIRGDVVVTPIKDGQGRTIDGQLDLFQLDAYVTVLSGESQPDTKPLLEGSMEMELDPQGYFYLGVEDLQTVMMEMDVTLDADLRLLFSPDLGYGIEGGITLFDVETELMTVSKAGAVAGFTVKENSIYLLYVGATLDLWLTLENIGTINAGGAFLIGRLDPI